MSQVYKALIRIFLTIILIVIGFAVRIPRIRACSDVLFGYVFDLKISDQDEKWENGVSGTWGAVDMGPGEEFAFEKSYVSLKNFGFIPADHLEIGIEYNLVGNGEDAVVSLTDSMAGKILFTRLEYGSGDWNINLLTGEVTGDPPRPSGFRPGDWRVEDTDGDGKITFRDLKDDPLDDLPPPQFWMDERKCPTMRMSVRFADEADNRFMGVALNVSFVYTLSQCSRQ